MGVLIDLKQGRRHLLARRGFSIWNRRFGTSFDERTRPRDLPDAVLLQLIERNGGGGSIEEFVDAVLSPDAGAPTRDLDPGARMAAMDIALFLLDRLRFETMWRLGWVVDEPLHTTPLLTMVEDFAVRYAADRNQTPDLAAAHPHYPDYLRTFEGDRGAFVRRLTPQAIEAFAQRLREQTPRPQ